MFHIRIEEIPSPITFVTEWASISLKNAWLLLLFVNIFSKPSTVHKHFKVLTFSWMNTILIKFSKFPMSPVPVPSSSSLTVTIFLKGCVSLK